MGEMPFWISDFTEPFDLSLADGLLVTDVEGSIRLLAVAAFLLPFDECAWAYS